MKHTLDRSVEEIVEEFDQKFVIRGKEGRYRVVKLNEYMNGEDAVNWLTQTLQAERQKQENTYKVLLQYIESDKVDLAKRTLQGLLTHPNNPIDVGFFLDKEKGNMWRNEDGSVEKYKHQDDRFAKLCDSQYCRCSE